MADSFTTFNCRLSWNLGNSTSWKPQDLSRPVMGLLYLYLYLSFHALRFTTFQVTVSYRLHEISFETPSLSQWVTTLVSSVMAELSKLLSNSRVMRPCTVCVLLYCVYCCTVCIVIIFVLLYCVYCCTVCIVILFVLLYCVYCCTLCVLLYCVCIVLLCVYLCTVCELLYCVCIVVQCVLLYCGCVLLFLL